MSPLKELSKAVSILLVAKLQPQKEQRKELEKILQSAGSLTGLIPVANGPCNRDARINTHLGAGGVMTPGRIQEPEGAETMVISFKTTRGAILAVHCKTYEIVFFRDATTGRLGVAPDATARGN